MKVLTLLFLAAFASNQSFANTAIEVTEPNFTADRIELNPVTNTYVVVNPSYSVDALDDYRIAWDGVVKSENGHTAKHLCTFLGMSGGKVISYTTINFASKCEATISIDEEGLYGFTSINDRRYGCRLIDFLECAPL